MVWSGFRSGDVIMANYAVVRDNQVVECFEYLPTNWANISNLSYMSVDELVSVGIYPISRVYSYDPSTQAAINIRYQFRDGVVYEDADVVHRESTLAQSQQRMIEEAAAALPQFSKTVHIIDQVRAKRDQLMRMQDWRYARYHRQMRLGVPPSDDISLLDQYMQKLADVTSQLDLYNVQWPDPYLGQPPAQDQEQSTDLNSQP